MSVNRKIIAFVLFCFCLQGAYAQVNDPKKEANNKKDKTEVYQKIKNYSQKNKFTQTIHKLLFRGSRPQKKEIVVQNDTTDFSGKIIDRKSVV